MAVAMASIETKRAILAWVYTPSEIELLINAKETSLNIRNNHKRCHQEYRAIQKYLDDYDSAILADPNHPHRLSMRSLQSQRYRAHLDMGRLMREIDMWTARYSDYHDEMVRCRAKLARWRNALTERLTAEYLKNLEDLMIAEEEEWLDEEEETLSEEEEMLSEEEEMLAEEEEMQAL